jgi:hypothetical protein
MIVMGFSLVERNSYRGWAQTKRAGTEVPTLSAFAIAQVLLVGGI